MSAQIILFADHSRRARERAAASRQGDLLLETNRFGLSVALSIVAAALLPFAWWRCR